MGSITDFSLGLGLAGLAGFRAYFPLVIAGLLTRYSPDVQLGKPFDVLGSVFVLLILLVLLSIEFFADKMPAVVALPYITHLPARAVAGGILFYGFFPLPGLFIGFTFGAIIAILGYWLKYQLRPNLVNYFDNVNEQVISTVEDVISIAGTIIIILFPLLALLAIVILFWLGFRRFKEEVQPGIARRGRLLK